MKKNVLLIIMINLTLFLTGCINIFHEHKFIINEVLPTCTEQGYIEEVCECGEKNILDYTNPLHHAYGEWETITAATMISEGTKQQKCSRCDSVVTEILEKRQYPDLGGYTINIAVSEYNLHAYDPFNDSYYYDDKEAKQKALKEVEKNFNCHIKYVGYPIEIDYGPVRWNYIINKINDKTLYYDFCEVPNGELGNFIENSEIINLEDYYYKYSPNLMNEVQKSSSSYKNDIYAISDSKEHYINIMIYNMFLLKQLQSVDPTLKEPAQIYLEGNWTQDEFVRYCEQVQSAMEKLYGEKGKKGSEKQEYYAFGGWPTNLWAGLSTSKQEPIIDTKTKLANLTTETKMKNLDFVKGLYDNNLADPNIAYTGCSISFHKEKALFECGDISEYLRQYNPFYGAGDYIDIGFVLFPRENNTSFEDIDIPTYNSRYYIMIEQQVYSRYGSECNAENIYWAFSELLEKTREYCDNKNWDSITMGNGFKEAICDSEATKQLCEYLHTKFCNDEIYYEQVYDYPFEDTLFSKKIDYSISQTLNAYIFNELDTTWEEAVQLVIVDLKKRLNYRYG